jgi:hypothetical protein
VNDENDNLYSVRMWCLGHRDDVLVDALLDLECEWLDCREKFLAHDVL